MKNNESPSFSHSSNKGLAIETFPAKIPESTQPEKKPRNIPKHRFGSIDAACIAVCIGCLLANEFICNSAVHYFLIGMCVLSLFVPAAIQCIRMEIPTQSDPLCPIESDPLRNQLKSIWMKRK